MPPSITLALTPELALVIFCAIAVRESEAPTSTDTPFTTSCPTRLKAEVASVCAAEAILFACARNDTASW